MKNLVTGSKKNLQMLNSILSFVLTILLLMVFSPQNANAQNPRNGLEASGIEISPDARTVVVEPDDFPLEVGSLNNTIAQEIQTDPNTIFILKRDATYWTLGSIENPDFRLHLRAEEGEGHPPIIRPATDLGQGIYPFRTTGDIILEGIYLIGIDETGQHQELIYNVGDSSYIILDNCWISGNFANMIQTYGTGNKIYITNSVVWNSGRNEEDQNGRLLECRDTPQDIIYIENNTVYNMGHAFVRQSGGALINHLYINHNTLMNISQYTRVGGVQNLEIKNNIFRNVYTIGEYTKEQGRAWIEIQNQPSGFDESQRNLVISYNNIGYLDEEFYPLIEERDAYHESDTVAKAPNVSRMYMDPANDLPDVIYENNIEEKIDFTDPPSLENYVDWTKQWMMGRDGVPFGGDPQPITLYDHPVAYDRWDDASHDPVPYHFTVDLIRDFTYSTSHQSYTAAENGFPLGDLNWFPEQKERWIAGLEPLSVTEIAGFHPENFKIVGNYPNPFNPTTKIIYELPRQSEVTMEVFNILGQRVSIVYLGTQAEGRYEYTFDAADLPSGLFIVKMSMDRSNSVVHKIMLLK